MMEKVEMKRLGVYFFYDSQGIADDYVFYFLKGICPYLSGLYIVCNGFIEEKFLERLKQEFSKNVIVRENDEFDVGAYKAAMDQVGFARLADYDELILMNYTVFGPLMPFDEMFAVMDSKDLDFWGITSHSQVDWNPFPQNGFSSMPEHIQSHFLVIRKKILSSPLYKKYWDDLPRIKSYEDSVSHFECTFTQYFSSRGFKWGTYSGTEQMAHIAPNPIMTIPHILVKDRKCPIIKRRSFFQNYKNLLYDTNGDVGRKLLDYIKENLSYPVDLIWENLLRTCNHESLRECLQLNYILPDQYEIPGNIRLDRVALWMHIYYMDLAEECLNYALSMPEGSDILLTTDTKEKAEQLKKTFSGIQGHKVKVILIKNRGRDNSALLVGLSPYWKDYDIVCFAHDKKIRHLEYEARGRTFSEHCFYNTLISQPFVHNVLQAFADEPRLGMLCPPPPNTSAYYNTIGISDWGPNYEKTKMLYDRLGLSVPISQAYSPVAPFGFVFWFRTKAMKNLFTYGWTYEDFPPEPVDFDGSFLHAVERIIPYAVQQAGYYSAWLLSSSFAATELTNYHYMLRELNRTIIPICGSGDFQDLCSRAKRFIYPGRRVYLLIKRFLKSHLSDEHFYKLQKTVNRFFKK